MSKRALITGITGQDGSYLADLLLARDYQVFGLVRRTSTDNTRNIQHLLNHPRLELLSGDMQDASSLQAAVQTADPQEVYNLAAQSLVHRSWSVIETTLDVIQGGLIRLLEAVRTTKPNARVYQAGSSEMFGSHSAPQSERTPFHPNTPYGLAKVGAHWAAVNYREHFGLFVCSGILFNHESPRRSPEFVTQKIAQAAARIKLGLGGVLQLGNLDSRRDWGFAGDYVEAMWMTLQHDRPADYVIGTGRSHTVRDFLSLAFAHVGLDWHRYVEQTESLKRSGEVSELVANPDRAFNRLGWRPRTDLDKLVRMMVDYHLVHEAKHAGQ